MAIVRFSAIIFLLALVSCTQPKRQDSESQNTGVYRNAYTETRNKIDKEEAVEAMKYVNTFQPLLENEVIAFENLWSVLKSGNSSASLNELQNEYQVTSQSLSEALESRDLRLAIPAAGAYNGFMQIVLRDQKRAMASFLEYLSTGSNYKLQESDLYYGNYLDAYQKVRGHLKFNKEYYTKKLEQ